MRADVFAPAVTPCSSTRSPSPPEKNLWTVVELGARLSYSALYLVAGRQSYLIGSAVTRGREVPDSSPVGGVATRDKDSVKDGKIVSGIDEYEYWIGGGLGGGG